MMKIAPINLFLMFMAIVCVYFLHPSRKEVKSLRKKLDLCTIVIEEQDIQLSYQKSMRDKQLQVIDSVISNFKRSEPNVNEAMIWLRQRQ